MGKFSFSQDTAEKIRAARVNYLTPGPDAGAPKDFAKILDEANRKIGPWKWWERVTIQDIVINENDGTTDEGKPVDRWDIKFQVSEDSPTNPGKMHIEFLRLVEPDVDAYGDVQFDKRTNYALGVFDQIVQAALDGNYTLNDEGDNDPELTADALKGCELNMRVSLGTRINRNTKEWLIDCSAVEFAAID